MPEEVYQVESDGDNVKWWEVGFDCSSNPAAMLSVTAGMHGITMLLLCMQVNELTKLDMSYNELKQLPAELWSLVALNTLLLRCV